MYSFLRNMRAALVVVILGTLQDGSTAAEDWPQFRGPRGDGTTSAALLPTTWSSQHGIAWQAEVPGRGWSSPIVLQNRVWLTSAETTALTNEQREQRLAASAYREYADQFQAYASVALYAHEFDLRTGELLRTLELFNCENPPPIHATNTYASPTPVSDGQRLYCHFGSLGTCCVDLASGQVVWRQRLIVDDITGAGSSPVLWQGKLIVPCDGVDQQFVAALDGQSGQVVWKTARPKINLPDGKQHRAFSTPLIIDDSGRQQMIVPGAQWVVSYNPENGAELWRVNFGDGHATVPRPVYDRGIVYICTGFMKPQLWAIRVEGRGDVTNTQVVWKYEKQVPDISSPVISGGAVYLVSSLGVATCLDAKTGELVWQKRIGGNFAASPLAAGETLYFTSREGVTTVLRAGREYDEVARNQLFGQTMASLAAADGALLIRADRVLYCLREAAAAAGGQP